MEFLGIYKSASVENGLYDFWLQNDLFSPIKKTKTTKNFSIILPPPNITGQLHIGHALDFTIQDAIIRYKKMCGFRTIWIPGTDHAGIATQTKFEKILKEKGVSRASMKPEEFLSQLNSWAQAQSTLIHQQEAKMGFALSYKHEAFTLDKNIYDLIYKEFIRLYKDGLIYRANKLVNWDIVLNSAISDVEVEYKLVKSKMYHFKYVLDETPDEYLVVATTRPETMFVDTNLFVNPDDTRYKKYIGKHAINPINGERLLILSDHYIDIKFGTGVMKCTPAHDFNDYKLALEYGVKNFKSVIGCDGKLNQYAKTKYGNYVGLDRIAARTKIVNEIIERDLLDKIEDYESNVGFSQRTGAIVEPLLSLQWFVKMKPIVKNYRLLAKKSKTVFYPDSFKKEIDRWLDNIQDWCISRNLVYGHTIPAWYHKKTGKIYVGVTPPKKSDDYVKETAVLDTWFSSGLWPLALTKYAKTNDLSDFYPIDMLVTGRDIITFWVARMLFQCSYLDHSVPLKNVILHGLVRDANNQKMSKSLNNVVNPLDIVNEYGADTLRLFLLSSCPSSGQDIVFSKLQLKYYWGFINKLWNCANLVDKRYTELPAWDKLHIISKWIITKHNKCLITFKKHFEKYNFILASKCILDFAWDSFCNSYIDTKNIVLEEEKNAVIFYIYKNILLLLHPFIPFVTEYIYQKLYASKKSIMLESFPVVVSKGAYKENDANVLISILAVIRGIRIKYGIKMDRAISFYIDSASKMEGYRSDFAKANITLLKTRAKNVKHVPYSVAGKNIFVEFNFENTEDTKKNKETLLKNLLFEIKRSKKILGNKSFVKNAPKEKVLAEKQKLENYQKEYDKLLEPKH